MKSSKKILVMLVATLMVATKVWAGDVTSITKLNGTVNANVGTVSSQVNGDDNQCTLTVTPASGYYIVSVTAGKTISGNMAQAPEFRAPAISDMLTVTPTDETADPSGVTTWTFDMPDSEYGVEVVADFGQRTDISEATVTLAETSFSFDGNAKTPAVTSVTLDGNTIDAANYEVAYGDDNHNNVNAGTVTVYVTGKNTYTGTATTTFTINKASINPTVELVGWTYGQQPETITPVVQGNLGGGTPTFTYKAAGAEEFTTDVPQNAGTHTIKASIPETANYSGAEPTDTFTIYKADLDLGIDIEGWTYGETPVTPEVTGNLGNGAVTITYQGENDDEPTGNVPTNAGGYTVFASVVETANYNAGETMREFSIEQADLSEVVIANIADQTYTGDSIKATITVTFNGNEVDASEYTVHYADNTNVGTATVTLTSNDINFTDGDTAPTKTFQIVAAEVVITAEDQTETYNGQAQQFTNYSVGAGQVVVTYYASEEDRTARQNALSEVIDAETYYVLLTQGNSNYTSSAVNATFTIQPKSLDDVSLWSEGEDYFIYDGQPKMMEGEGMYGLDDEEIGTSLTEDEDFTVSYTNNVNVGTATMTFTGMGNYTGTKTSTFAIVRELNISFSETRQWATYYAEEDLEIPEGLSAFIVTEIGTTEVTVDPIDYIPQHQGVLLAYTEDIPDELVAYAYEGTTTEDFEDNLLLGTSTGLNVSTIQDGAVYVLYNNEFVKSVSGTIPANRGYLVVPADEPQAHTLSIALGDEANGISEVVETAKMNNGQYYNLQGQRVAQPTKGLVIVNGKKMIVK